MPSSCQPKNDQIPDHSILDGTPNLVVSKAETDMDDANETMNAGSAPIYDDSCVSGCRVTKVFYKYGYQTLPISYEQLEYLYMKRASWLEKYQPVPLSYLRLFIFADIYNVHQLREDILTSMLGHVTHGIGVPTLTKTSFMKYVTNCPVPRHFHGTWSW
jgi:hypothetical protein